MRKGIATNAIVRIGLMLIFLVVGFSLLTIIAGGGENFFNKIGFPDYSCKNDVGEQSFEEFLAHMKEVYNDCDKEDDRNCKYSGCVKMKLVDSKDCYIINKNTLTDPFFEKFGDNLRLACNREWSRSSTAIDVYNKKSKIGEIPNGYGVNNDIRYCVENYVFTHGLFDSNAFSISKGDTIKISAYRSGLIENDKEIIDTVDTYLKIEISGGTEIEEYMARCNQENLLECKNDPDCDKANWGYCENNNCVYTGYCKHFENSCQQFYDTCPLNVDLLDPNPKTCTKNEASCPDPKKFKTKILELIEINDKKKVRFEISHEGTKQNFLISENEEIWFKKIGNTIVKTGMNSKNPDSEAKLVVWLKEITQTNNNDYNVFFYQNCF